VKFGRVRFEMCERTQRQTDTHARWSQYFASSRDQVIISAYPDNK